MTTWNPSDKSASVTLSGGNLTATMGGSAGGVRSTTGYSAGQLYWEVTLSGGAPTSSTRQGVANATQALNAALGGAGGNSIGWNASSGAMTINGSSIGTSVGYTTGDVLSYALDLTNSKVWTRVNGGNWNNNGSADPATNTGGFSTATLAAGPYFMLSNTTVSAPTAVATMKPDAPSFTYGVPGGFSAWDVAGGGIVPSPYFYRQHIERAAA